MKKLVCLLSLIMVGGVIFVDAQVRGRPDPTPQSPSDKAIQRSNDISRRSSDLRNTETFIGNDLEARKRRKAIRKAINPLYRKAKKSELKIVEPDAELKARYSTFLKNKKAGLIKLIKDRGCADVADVVNATKECAIYSMPGAGSSYSFRIKNYRVKNLGDINYTGKSFEALGVLLHGVMVNLGDVPIESVNANNSGYKYIKNFKPADDFKKAAEYAKKLQKGMKQGNLMYASVLPAKTDSTYILRSIAYKGEALRTVAGITYNELDFDKRKDVTIAFRVVQQNSDSITILWKELDNKKSPKLEVAE